MDYRTGKWLEDIENRIANIEQIIAEVHPEYGKEQAEKPKKKEYEKKEYGKTA